jgi:hypothetical protein
VPVVAGEPVIREYRWVSRTKNVFKSEIYLQDLGLWTVRFGDGYSAVSCCHPRTVSVRPKTTMH